MKKDNLSTCFFENERMTFRSYVYKFTQDIFKEFDSKANQIDLNLKISDLFGGKKVNFTEGIGAWHPKYRNDYKPLSHITPSNIDQEIKIHDLQDFFKEAKNIVTLGIGGSLEGPKMLLENLNIKHLEKKLFFITGSDLLEFHTKINKLNQKDTIFIVSSKSFKTYETKLMLQEAISWSGEIQNFLAITTNKKEAEKYNIKKIIEFDKEIGGRYSIWSEISLITYLLSKGDFDDFMAGGKKADNDLENNDSYLKFVKHLAYSDIWLHNFENKKSRVVLSYIWSWRSLPHYIQQLEMESLGKQPNINSEFQKTGQIIFGGYGPKAQHSYFQLLHQGTHEICADIVASNNDKISLNYAQSITQSKLLSQGAREFKGIESINGNTPTNLFLVNNPGFYDLGYLIATWEHRVFITAMMLGINPFDQFGVSAGKIYTSKYLADKN